MVSETLPFAGGQWRLQMGLRAVAIEGWLAPDGDLASELAEKRALLAARPGEVFAALPGCEDAAVELLALLASHLPRHHPHFFRREGERLLNLVTGENWDVRAGDLHPLDLCGRLVQEDFCLMLPGAAGYALAGATLSAPNRWRLAEKLGRSLDAIHDVVPGYAEVLARPVARFFSDVRPGKIVGRVNWGIADRPDRFLPVAAARVPVSAENAGEILHLRIERQTLRKLEGTAAVVFTIRTCIAPLARALATRADAADLAGAIRTMPIEMQRYKAIAPIAAALLEWLEARALTA